MGATVACARFKSGIRLFFSRSRQKSVLRNLAGAAVDVKKKNRSGSRERERERVREREREDVP